MNTLKIILSDESATRHFAQILASELSAPLWTELIGSLGAGKTTFTRYVLQALGHQGNVKSPTYTLVEPYTLEKFNFYHFDLYRLSDPEELEYLGIRDYIEDNSIGFVEWPSKGLRFLPKPDLSLNLDFYKKGRQLQLQGNTIKGIKIIDSLKTNFD